jgi:hypothetical protein
MNKDITASEFITHLLTNNGVVTGDGEYDCITVSGPVRINAKKLGLPGLNLRNIIFKNLVRITNFTKKEVLIVNSSFLKGLELSRLIGSKVLLVLTSTIKMLCNKIINCCVITTNMMQLVAFISNGIVAELCEVSILLSPLAIDDSSGEISLQA